MNKGIGRASKKGCGRLIAPSKKKPIAVPHNAPCPAVRTWSAPSRKEKNGIAINDANVEMIIGVVLSPFLGILPLCAKRINVFPNNAPYQTYMVKNLNREL